MSRISLIHDALHTKVASILTEANGWVELPSRLIDSKIDETRIQKAWVIKFVGASNNTRRELDCSISIERQIQVFLYRQSQLRDFDLTGKKQAEKDLFEAEKLLIDGLDCSELLDNTTELALVSFQGDDGIESAIPGRGDAIQLIVNFSFEYFEEKLT